MASALMLGSSDAGDRLAKIAGIVPRMKKENGIITNVGLIGVVAIHCWLRRQRKVAITIAMLRRAASVRGPRQSWLGTLLQF
jgi:hypothetical protein